MSPFSTQTVTALAEVITGGSANTSRPPVGIYRSGPDLITFFRHLGHEITVGSRVPSVRQFLDELHARPDGEVALTLVIEQAADPRDFLNDPDRLAAVVEYLKRRLTLDGFSSRRGRNDRRVAPSDSRSARAEGKVAPDPTSPDFPRPAGRRSFPRRAVPVLPI